MDYSPPAFSVHKIFQENSLGNLPQFSLVQSLSRVQLCDPMDCSMPGFPVHHHLGIKPASLHLHAGGFFTIEPPGKPLLIMAGSNLLSTPVI